MNTPHPELPYSGRLVLVVAEGPSRGRSRALEETCADRGLVVGRSKSCGLQLADTRASRKHFAVIFRDGSWQVRDLGSCNGTIVNDVPISADVVVSAGDSIRAGDTLLLVVKDDVEWRLDEPQPPVHGNHSANPESETCESNED